MSPIKKSLFPLHFFFAGGGGGGGGVEVKRFDIGIARNNIFKKKTHE